jgi:folylpolyglutamate synthase/dihydropteroate synthase
VAAALGAATAPGRLEVVRRRPLVVLDGAHNPDAAVALMVTLREAFTWDRLHLVMAMFEDKDVEAVTRELAGVADRAYVSETEGARSAAADRVADGLRNGGAADVQTFPTVEGALETALAEAGEDDLILVTGSFYTVGDARRFLADGPNPPKERSQKGTP